MYRPLIALIVSLLFTASLQSQVLDLNPVGEELLPLPTPADSRTEPELAKTAEPTVAGNPLALESPIEANSETPEAATETMVVRELQGEPIQSGPIHEAFAEPLQLTPQPTEVLKLAPPAVIEEIAPEADPDDQNMQWISGYWAWDQQREDYVWVSGVWRKIPKGRRWSPGRWESVEGGYQWVPGAWLKTGDDGEIINQEVLKLPPKSLEEGPTSPAPSEDHFWIPGVWKQNEQGEFAWRPGFWSQSHENWVWTPDHYTWSPSGCTFVAGYWDYPWERRGTLYAPCTFGAANLSGQVYYRPTQVIDTTQWLVNLWVGPQYGHYYYGDYYDYAGLGYSPWYSYYGANRGYYDPFYTYYRWRFPLSYGIGLYGYLDGLHSYYRGHSSYRPRVSTYGYKDWNRRYRGHASLYGNVPDLYGRLGKGDYNDRYRHDTRGHDHYDRTYRGGGKYAGNRGRNGGGGDRERRQSANSRDSIGYANEQALYRDQRGNRGVTRAEIGTSGSRGVTRAEIGARERGNRGSQNSRNELEQLRRSPRQANERQAGERQSSERQAGERRVNERQANERRANERQSNERQSMQRQVERSRSQLRNLERPNNRSVATPRNEPTVTRSRPAQRSQTMSRPDRQNFSGPRTNVNRPAVSRPAPRVSRPAPQTSRPAPRVSRPAPQVSRPTQSRAQSQGFTTSGMKRARGADLTRQRAAMKNRMSQRKGK